MLYEVKYANFIASNMRWDEPNSLNNYCYSCKTPLITYWISGEDGGSHLGCEYLGSEGSDYELGSFHGSLCYSGLEKAKDYAKAHYARMIYPDTELGQYIFQLPEKE